MRIGRFLVVISVLVAIAAVFFVYSRPAKYAGVHYGIDLFHAAAKTLFFISGAYYDSQSFHRPMWDFFQIRAKPGLDGLFWSDGVLSVDMKIPSLWKKDQNDNYQVPVRVFMPKPPQDGKVEKYPVFVYFHGGGFVFINVADMFYDILCRYFAAERNVIVVAVEYRLAPENKFPAALMDCYSATLWALQGKNPEITQFFDREKVVILGDSAGATLAIGVSLLARDRKETIEQIALQVLFYPGTYYNQTTESLLLYGDDAYMLPEGKYTALWFHNQYADFRTNLFNLIDEDDSDSIVLNLEPPTETIREDSFPLITQPYLNPWNAQLHDLPNTLMIAAELDPLRDEQILFTKELHKAGVQTKLWVVKDTVHGFFVLPFLNETKEARRVIYETCDKVFSKQPLTD